MTVPGLASFLEFLSRPQTLGVLRWRRMDRQRGASWAIDPVPLQLSPTCPSFCLPHQCVQFLLKPPHPTLSLSYALESPGGASVQGPKPRLFVGPKYWFFLKAPE